MKTKQDYVEYLNELGIPDNDRKSNGGRVPDNAKFGDWLRQNDCIMFNVSYREFENL